MDKKKEMLALLEEVIYMNKNIPSLDSYYMIKKLHLIRQRLEEIK